MAKSAEFEMNYGKHKNVSHCDISNLMKDEEISVIHELLSVPCQQDNPRAISKNLLGEVQRRAQLLVIGN